MPVEVRCTTDSDGYRCTVEVSDASGKSHYRVRVSGKDFQRWSRGRSAEALVRDSFAFLIEREAKDVERWSRGRTVEELVGDSFAFLLEREPKESILKEFDLALIRRYFPEYDGA